MYGISSKATHMKNTHSKNKTKQNDNAPGGKFKITTVVRRDF
jgi:hypothetical protein